MTKFIVDNLVISYLEEGDGPIILMLHGLGEDLHTFDALARELPGFRIVRLNLPGFGGSDMPPSAWDLDRYARFVALFMRKLNFVPHAIVGHSLGARIALKGIAAETLAPERLVLIASGGLTERSVGKSRAFSFLVTLAKAFLWLPLLRFFYDDIRQLVYRYLRRDVRGGKLKETMVMIAEEQLGAAAAQIAIPTLLIWGSDDRETPLAEGRELHRLMTEADLHVFDGAGHQVHEERPHEVAAVIRDFLR